MIQSSFYHTDNKARTHKLLSDYIYPAVANVYLILHCRYSRHAVLFTGRNI